MATSTDTIVVTGAAGLIGSAIVCELNRAGIDDILAVDRLDTSDKWKNLASLRFADYQDADTFEAALLADDPVLRGIGTIFHLGACSSTVERDVAFLMRNNFEYTKNVARWSVAHGVRLVYASSAATYGALESNLSDSADLHALRPLNGYAFSKQAFDLYAQRQGWFDTICGVKYFNIFGPNEGHKAEMRSLVNKAFEQIRSRGFVELFKSYRPEYRDGEQERDFLYVKDAATMTVHLARSTATGLVNVGSGGTNTWIDLVRPIFTALDVPERIEFIEMPEVLRGKYQYSTCADIRKLRASGYVAPITPLADAVRDYVINYLEPEKRLEP
jgi:ADP-L-glycero-D-manno-heptose 6-epimerase